MKVKYFTAESREAAEALAGAYFECDRSRITSEVVSERQENGKTLCQILALTGTPGELENMDARFGTFFENDGVYLELYKERGKGSPIDNSLLSRYISRKNISRFDGSAAQALFSARKG